MFMTRESMRHTCMNLCSSDRVAAMEARRADKDCTAGVFVSGVTATKLTLIG